jgi:hypothetical protein
MDSKTHVTGRKPRSFRPLHSFSLRTLFVVVTLLACWLGYNLRWSRLRADALRHHHNRNDEWSYSMAPWPLKMFGAPGLPFFTIPSDADPAEINKIRSLFPEATLHFSDRERPAERSD